MVQRQVSAFQEDHVIEVNVMEIFSIHYLELTSSLD